MKGLNYSKPFAHGQEKEGHIVLENSNPMSPYLQFNIQDDQVSTLLKNLSESCKKMIAMGFLSPSNLEQSMNYPFSIDRLFARPKCIAATDA